MGELHANLVGDDLHIAKSQVGVENPNGVITAEVIGQFHWDSVNNRLYAAEAVGNADWRFIAGEVFEWIDLIDTPGSIVPRAVVQGNLVGTGLEFGSILFPSAYGSMFEDNVLGSSIALTTSYIGWVTAAVGIADGTLVTFTDDATADRLTVGTDGAGRYQAEFHVNLIGMNNQLVTAALHVNGVEQVEIKMTTAISSSQPRVLSSSGILDLADADFVDLRFIALSAFSIDVFQVSVNLSRIGGP